MCFSANRGFLNQNINKVQLIGVVKERGIMFVVWSASHRYGFLILHCSGGFYQQPNDPQVCSSQNRQIYYIHLQQLSTQTRAYLCMYKCFLSIKIQYEGNTVALILYIRYINSRKNMTPVYKMALRTQNNAASQLSLPSDRLFDTIFIVIIQFLMSRNIVFWHHFNILRGKSAFWYNSFRQNPEQYVILVCLNNHFNSV